MAQSSRLLALPKELRLCILDQLFSEQETITIGLPSHMPWHCKPLSYHPTVAEVCSQLREDALALYYHSRRVVLLLRYREGRKQVQQWIDDVLRRPKICSKVDEISIQYFEQAHRSTSLLVNLRDMRVENRDSWLHPLIGRPLKLLGYTERLLDEANLTQCESWNGRPLKLLLDAEKTLQSASVPQIEEVYAHCNRICNLMKDLVDVMLTPLQSSRLLRCESMANLRLHGYTDFQLRFEVISIMYSSVDC